MLDGLITPTRPRLPTGGHPIRNVVTDDTTLVADLGNAGRPYAVVNRTNPALKTKKPAPAKKEVLTARPIQETRICWPLSIPLFRGVNRFAGSR